MTDHPTERPTDQLTKVCIEKSQVQISPSAYPDIATRLTLLPVDLPGFPPSTYPDFPARLPCSPSGYPDFSPRQVTRISPRQVTLHTLSGLKHPLLPLPSNPLQRSYLIPPKETKKSKNILSKLRLSPTTYPLEPTGPLPDLFS